MILEALTQWIRALTNQVLGPDFGDPWYLHYKIQGMPIWANNPSTGPQSQEDGWDFFHQLLYKNK